MDINTRKEKEWNKTNEIPEASQASEVSDQEVMNWIINSIGQLYYALYHIWLDTNTFVCFRQETLEPISSIGKKGTYTEAWDCYVNEFIMPDDRNAMREFGDYATLAQRLHDVNNISQVYYRKNIGWIRAQFIVAKRDEVGNATSLVLTFRDINEEIELEEQKKQAIFAAEHDPLTNLYNRKGFEKIIKSQDFSDSQIGFALIDVDNFKSLNDCYGHDVGDQVLDAVAHNLRRVFRSEDKLFRLGGDELAVLLHNCDEVAWNIICSKIEAVHAQLEKKFEEKFDVNVTLSVGLCFSNHGYNDEMYLLADEALYKTKQNGRAGCTWIDSNHVVRSQWRDEGISVHTKSALEYKNSEIYRMEIPADPKEPRRLICGEATKMVFGAPADATPEECYQLWESGIDPEYQPTLKEAVKAMVEHGQSECTYLWNHPTWGKIYVRSSGFGEIKDGKTILNGYHHVLKDTKLIEKKDDKELIAEALSDVYLEVLYWNLKEDTFSTFKASPVESQLKQNNKKTSLAIEEFIQTIVAPEDREKMQEFLNTSTLQSRLGNDKRIECEYRNLSLNGWCRGRLIPIKYDENGKLTHVLIAISLLDAAKAEE